MSESLIIAVEDGAGRRFVTGTSAGIILVGRSHMADLRLVNAAVSAVHLKLIVDKGLLRVQDLGSKNGTFLDHRQLPAQQVVEVPPASELDLGATFRLTFSWGELPAACENPFSEGEVEEDDGTARLHPAALSALREKIEGRQAVTLEAQGSAPSALGGSSVPPSQPPSLRLPWMRRDVVEGPASPPQRAADPGAAGAAPVGRGRITLAGTADAASFGANQASPQPGNATVARVRLGALSSTPSADPAVAPPARAMPSPLPAVGRLADSPHDSISTQHRDSHSAALGARRPKASNDRFCARAARRASGSPF